MSKYDINSLSVEEKIGQLIMFGFDALTINEHAINLIKNYKVGNVILFARNVKTPRQLFELNQSLQQLALETIGIPLIISIDQEGGMVTRIKNGGTFYPGAMTLGATHNKENAYLTGKYMGTELINLGINLNLAPVLDVNNNPNNPVIGVRSFSDNPKMVSEFGNEFIRGMQENVIATAKHFPGHGDTQVDSHLALPTIDYDVERLEKIELYPFKEAIKKGVKAIMSSHINFPAFTEDGLPTTLSKKCITGLLREKLGFKGLVVTDCMQMKAIQDNYTTPIGTLMAINAGANLVCISHSERLQTESVKKLYDAVKENELTLETINERVQKILQYKEEIRTDSKKYYHEVKHLVESKENKDFAYQAVVDGISLVKGNPISNLDNTLVIAVNPIATTIADEEDGVMDIISNINKEIPHLDTTRITVYLSKDEINSVVQKARLYKQVVFCSYNANIYKSQIDLIESLCKEVDTLHVVAMRNPYDLFHTKSIQNFTCFYEYTPNSIVAFVDYLKGNIKPKGKPPVVYE